MFGLFVSYYLFYLSGNGLVALEFNSESTCMEAKALVDKFRDETTSYCTKK